MCAASGRSVTQSEILWTCRNQNKQGVIRTRKAECEPNGRNRAQAYTNTLPSVERLVSDNPRKASKKAVREQWHRAAVAVIAASRRDAGIKQDDLAAKLGWSRSKVAKIEAGARRIELPDFVLIARALNIDPETMFRRVMRW